MTSPTIPRMIGSYTGTADGPLIVGIGGIHGNEPAGVAALSRVLTHLELENVPFRGKLIGLRGNLQALSKQERFCKKDLNRMWTPTYVAHLHHKQQTEMLGYEEAELMALHQVLSEFETLPHSPKILLDLHTTSATGGQFSVVDEDDYSRHLAANLHAPVILGLTRALVGTMASYWVDRGWHGMAFEAGQHDDPQAIDDHEAAIWMVLDRAGCLANRQMAHPHSLHLEQQARQVPTFVEVVYRHPVQETDQFRMRAGYVNFQAVEAGEPLADDKHGPVVAPFDGMMLMPLYQSQGADGFFIIQPQRLPR